MMRLWFRSLVVVCLVTAGTCPLRAEQLRVIVRDSEGKPLPDVAVLAASVDGKKRAAAPSTGVIDQIDKEFVPHVTAVSVGTSVSFPNKDDIRHHVYSFSPAKTFELPLYHGTPAKPVVFDKKGVVKLGCNIHDWMRAYVYVTDASYFGTTDSEGRTKLDGLASGTYRVWVWHPQMTGSETETTRTIELSGTSTQTWNLRLSTAFRPPRATLPGAAGYR